MGLAPQAPTPSRPPGAAFPCCTPCSGPARVAVGAQLGTPTRPQPRLQPAGAVHSSEACYKEGGTGGDPMTTNVTVTTTTTVPARTSTPASLSRPTPRYLARHRQWRRRGRRPAPTAPTQRLRSPTLHLWWAATWAVPRLCLFPRLDLARDIHIGIHTCWFAGQPRSLQLLQRQQKDRALRPRGSRSPLSRRCCASVPPHPCSRHPWILFRLRRGSHVPVPLVQGPPGSSAGAGSGPRGGGAPALSTLAAPGHCHGGEKRTHPLRPARPTDAAYPARPEGVQAPPAGCPCRQWAAHRRPSSGRWAGWDAHKAWAVTFPTGPGNGTSALLQALQA
jgi:hypothetical protein